MSLKGKIIPRSKKLAREGRHQLAFSHSANMRYRMKEDEQVGKAGASKAVHNQDRKWRRKMEDTKDTSQEYQLNKEKETEKEVLQKGEAYANLSDKQANLPNQWGKIGKREVFSHSGNQLQPLGMTAEACRMLANHHKFNRESMLNGPHHLECSTKLVHKQAGIELSAYSVLSDLASDDVIVTVTIHILNHHGHCTRLRLLLDHLEVLTGHFYCQLAPSAITTRSKPLGKTVIEESVSAETKATPQSRKVVDRNAVRPRLDAMTPQEGTKIRFAFRRYATG
ncbi:hypothetical protein ARMGADRAFT_1040135 [Armillaria gallica]|uniref:Uncharacterized protein n=1 Tax=Armillaria gallica TaxID=47427 RepID=A0A2H3CW26_ARMGA|nr:hypothetical protein ARMGADRAFT_1040135 [Armillaria gallica]